jgi:hypothetical protein
MFEPDRQGGSAINDHCTQKRRTRSLKHVYSVLCCLVLVISFTVANSEEQEDSSSTVTSSDTELDDDFEEWLQAFSGLAPFLAASLFVIFSLHLLLYPAYALRSLMKEYLEAGTSIQGQALSCENKAGGDTFLVEVLYETTEHKFADNPSMKFRFPGAVQKKKFLRRFEYHREVPRGELVDVLLLPGGYGSRSGCPREVVERFLADYNDQQMHLFWALGFLVEGVVLAFSVREVLLMENPATGWTALFIGLGCIEVVSFLYCADQFLKSKQRRFYSARPFVTESERTVVDVVQRPMDPFKIPLHEFSGHARASERRIV